MKFKATLLIGMVSISAILFGMSDEEKKKAMMEQYKKELANQEQNLKKLGNNKPIIADSIRKRIEQLKGQIQDLSLNHSGRSDEEKKKAMLDQYKKELANQEHRLKNLGNGTSITANAIRKRIEQLKKHIQDLSLNHSGRSDEEKKKAMLDQYKKELANQEQNLKKLGNNNPRSANSIRKHIEQLKRWIQELSPRGMSDEETEKVMLEINEQELVSLENNLKKLESIDKGSSVTASSIRKRIEEVKRQIQDLKHESKI